jgi:hypothetical protein
MPRKLTREQRNAREAAAYREAGHAVAAYERAIMLKRLSVRAPNRDTGANVWNDPLRNVDFEWVKTTDSVDLIERLASVLIAGPVAQRTFAPRMARGTLAAERVRSVRTLLRAVDGRRNGAELLARVTREAERFIRLPKVKRTIQKLGAELMVAGQIDGESVTAIIRESIEPSPARKRND